MREHEGIAGASLHVLLTISVWQNYLAAASERCDTEGESVFPICTMLGLHPPTIPPVEHSTLSHRPGTCRCSPCRITGAPAAAARAGCPLGAAWP